MTVGEGQVRLETIQDCFEGIIPATICTVDTTGMPNITYLSVVSRVGSDHVALSRQFFNKTDRNTVVNPRAQVRLISPASGRQYSLDLEYERTETEGDLFERMRTKLDAVASHEGMGDVFRLKGVDICRVVSCAAVPCDLVEQPEQQRSTAGLMEVEEFARRISVTEDLEDLFQETLATCRDRLGYQHAFIMLADETGERLYTVASSGFGDSGAGSEVVVGEGFIGVAAARRQSVRVTNMSREMNYTQAVLASAGGSKSADRVERAIKLPGIPDVASQMVAPMLAHRQLVGTVCVQSSRPGAFTADDETVLNIFASQVAMAMSTLRTTDQRAATTDTGEASCPDDEPLHVRHYREDDSVFIDNEYLIKGVAGAILWRLLRTYEQEKRTEFSNRELRLDAAIGLPDIKDNLEARLILLRRRLEERCEYIRLEKSGRGRFRLSVDRTLHLLAVED